MTDDTESSGSSNSGDRTGQQLGNYRLLRLLGEGRDAQVYLAEHVELGQQAAVKVFQMELSERDSKLFYEQVRVFAPLLHPHILRVREAGMDGNVPFLVIDYAPNGSLHQRHPRGTVLAPDIVVSYVKDIADALQYAHGLGVSHLNLRPENILVGSRQELYIADFAIPIIIQNIRSTDLSDVARNMIYTAPETSPGVEGDQYALAAMIYEWLSGTLTYQGTGVEVVFQRMTRPPVPLREHVPSLAPAIETVVMRGLEKRPARRFASVQAFVEAFEQACAPGSTVNEAGAMYICRAPSPAVELLGETQEEQASSVETDTTVQSSKPVRGWGNARDTLVYYEHGNAVKSVAWSPDGERIVSGGYDSTARVWDVATQSTLVTYRGHSDPVERVAWSPDGQYIASASLDTTVQVWRAATGERVFSYQGHNNSVWAIAWSPDGKHIASGSEDGTARVWEALTGEPVVTYDGHNGAVEIVAWSPDGQSIASGSYDSTVRVWEAQSGKDILAYAGPGVILALAWSPDGKRIASGGDAQPVMQEDGTFSRADEQALHVWDATTGKDILAFGKHFKRIYAVCWSPDGRYLASSSIHHKVDVHDAATGELIAFHFGHNDQVFSVAWSPDGRRVASASQDGIVRVWRVDDRPWDKRVIIQDLPG